MSKHFTDREAKMLDKGYNRGYAQAIEDTAKVVRSAGPGKVHTEDILVHIKALLSKGTAK